MGADKMPDAGRGEGDYKASKDYDQKSEKFVEENRDEISAKAREAAKALDGSEGDKLREAEREGRSHARS